MMIIIMIILATTNNTYNTACVAGSQTFGSTRTPVCGITVL